MKPANEYEKAWWQQGRHAIVGIDEAGRGPIAGPLVVAAVRFPADFDHEEIYDSKKLSEKKRRLLFKEIIKLADEYHILIIDTKTVDELNIYRATQKAMEDLVQMFKQCDGVLTDAMPLKVCPCEYIPIIKGDQKSVSIAAASILAKVTRDGIMSGYDVLYPKYGFAKHKGYPPKAHIEAMHQYGVIDKIYRYSYGPVKAMDQLQFDI
ncbi:ribonuclease HII [Dielma fastidiosa]|uniref:ribonuclease HII n=1 Tax=Dielma fastidiosa TaxID=1034346 RepID=UPI0023F1C1BA|nr:ribonuclease HII [Dielma fastidiosa]